MVMYYTAKFAAIPNRVSLFSCPEYTLIPYFRVWQFLGLLYYALLLFLTFVVLFKSVWKQG